ncbi:MAG: hypothetical protein ACK6CT_01685 [Planctomycetia bacterium]|jgi:hypothetical protein
MRSLATLQALLIPLAAAGCAGDVPVNAPAQPPLAALVEAVREGRLDAITVTDRPLVPQDWERLRGLTGLRELVLDQGVADDTVADILGSLTGLQRLVLRESPLGDAGFQALARCTSLRDLNVPRAGCTVAGLEAIAGLESLRSLRLGGPGLRGPEVARTLATLPALQSLHLIDVPIGDEGLAALGGATGLGNLYLDGAGVSDRAWEDYFKKQPHVHVHVDQAHHDRDPGGDHPP